MYREAFVINTVSFMNKYQYQIINHHQIMQRLGTQNIYRVFLNIRSSLGKLTIKEGLMHLNSVWRKTTAASWHYHQGQDILSRVFLKKHSSFGRYSLKNMCCSTVYTIYITAAALWHCHQGQHILPRLLNSRDTKYSDVCFVVMSLICN
jgi:hypothetical protein